jgi:hypothetical protein
MTVYTPQQIAVSVHGPRQGPGGPTDTTWVVLARYTQPDTNLQRDLFAIIYSGEKEARAFAQSLGDTFKTKTTLHLDIR